MPDQLRQHPRELLLSLWLCVTAVHTLPAAETCHFRYRPPQVGDRGSQTVHLEINLVVTIEQGGQVVQSSDRGVRKHQQRTLKVASVEGGRVSKAQIRFDVANESSARNGQVGPSRNQPVHGKSYLVSRRENQPLRITDMHGGDPPPEEKEIVARAAEAIGRANPLAELLNGRTITVGQRVEVPRDIANELLGFREAIGDVQQFVLTLQKARTRHGTPCAAFDAHIVARPPDNPTKPLVVKGQMLIEQTTCRVAQLAVTCPVQFRENRGPEGGRFTVHGKGALQVTMHSRGATARR